MIVGHHVVVYFVATPMYLACICANYLYLRLHWPNGPRGHGVELGGTSGVGGVKRRLVGAVAIP